jgi:hypothetical protein
MGVELYNGFHGVKRDPKLSCSKNRWVVEFNVIGNFCTHTSISAK